MATGIGKRGGVGSTLLAGRHPESFRRGAALALRLACGILLTVVLIPSVHGWEPRLNAVRRVPAPSLEGGGEWVNSAGPIRLRELRGKFVILDFWTYCCINCLQTLPDLKRLEQTYPRELVVIGVHSPKFSNERDTENIREAVIRHGVDHPVVNDINLVLWRKYAVKGWPSLRIIDPQGYLIATHAGEPTFDMLDQYFKRAIPRARRDGILDETPLRFDLERYETKPTPLRFPGKVLVDLPSNRLFIADSGHNRIVITALDGRLLETVGNGAVGRQDGGYDKATFSLPQGMALRDEFLYVADTENHLVRKIDLKNKIVTTVAGNGQQAQKVVVRSSGRPTSVRLASPWDLWLHADDLFIAMAGAHQIWKMSLGGSRIHPFAGSGTEDVANGRLLPRTAFQTGYAAFAQPSGFASDGKRLFIADSEGSSIRVVPFQTNGNAATVLGTSSLPAVSRLFTYGDRDGSLGRGLLQHPLGLAYGRNRLYVADTYNNKIKEIDLEQSTIKTVAGDVKPGNSENPARFNEPGGLAIASGKLFVADTNNHLIRIVDIDRDYAVSTVQLSGLAAPRPPVAQAQLSALDSKQITFGTVEVKPTGNKLTLFVQLRFPESYELNRLAPMSYVIDVTGGDEIVTAEVTGKRIQVTEPESEFEIALPLTKPEGTTKLNVSLVYYYCRQSKALCRMGSVRWTGEVTLNEKGAAGVALKQAVR